MGVRLMVEVLEHAPAGLGPAERLMLIALAEKASDETRRVLWPRGSNPRAILRARLGMSDDGLRKVFGRLARASLDPRVSIATDSRGRPVYAFEGTATEYLIPFLRGGTNGPPLESERRDEQAATEAGRTGHLDRTDVPPLESERRDERPTQVPPSLGSPSPRASDLTADDQRAVLAATMLGVDEATAIAAVRAVVAARRPDDVARYMSKFTHEDVERWANGKGTARRAPAAAAADRPSGPTKCRHGKPGGLTIQGTGEHASRVCGSCEVDQPASIALEIRQREVS
ncbi:MAG: hypothetical protein OSB43_21800 [Nocardioides sp.]|uniref:hypothetical protein n=1 Tax=Nocardioides sp. TaxID=35761 RepID=UPI002382EF66|nr:hypothetical protein [Nocardioides sp.]MDE0778925.1 hypothetical protein [Nocardioides sp.]